MSLSPQALKIWELLIRGEMGERIKHLESKFSLASYELICACDGDELRFYLWLKLWAINKKSAWPSLGTITESLGMSRPALIRLIKSMEKKGRLIVSRKHRKNNIYDITWYDSRVTNLYSRGNKTLPKGSNKTLLQRKEIVTKRNNYRNDNKIIVDNSELERYRKKTEAFFKRMGIKQ